MSQRKKRVLFQSDFSLAKTGFGRNAKAVLSYLYSLDEYEILHFCGGLNKSHTSLSESPWRSIGTLPDNPRELERIEQDPKVSRMASYGAFELDSVVKEFKPDVYFAVQDIWGVDFATEKDWFQHTNSVIWTTLDSLPLLESSVKIASVVKNYWIWSEFATKEFHKLGHDHVKTVHGAVEDKFFRRLPDEERLNIRRVNNIPNDDFIVGFVFRNQLRKSVPNLIEGFASFKKDNDQAKNAKLLLHTHFGEGWNIQKLVKEYGLLLTDILTTYVCQNCKSYEVKSFQGENLNCSNCESRESVVTTNINVGVSEEQLNEVYNLMDVYCHPFTSGGQEFPIQEAKLSELITLVTNYSCGEDQCVEGSGTLPLEWTEYREHQTEFRKASTSPDSIAEQIQKVFSMPQEDKRDIEKQSRRWALENYSIRGIGLKIKDFIDSSNYIEESVYDQGKNKNPEAEIDEELEDSEWLVSLYEKILDRKISRKDFGFLYWMKEINQGKDRQEIENFFRNEASKKEYSVEDFIDDEGKDKRVLFIMPKTATDVFLSTSLFESISKNYEDCNIYLATDPSFFEILDGNPYIHKLIPYSPELDNVFSLEGNGEGEGYFKIVYAPHFYTQRISCYQHNGKDVIDYDTKA
jgi:glycosyltransferase involved in cell wall biosynthesis